MVAFKVISLLLAAAAPLSVEAYRARTGDVADPIDALEPEPSACPSDHAGPLAPGGDNGEGNEDLDNNPGGIDTPNHDKPAEITTPGHKEQHHGEAGAGGSAEPNGAHAGAAAAGDSLSTGAIAGIAVGAAAGCALLGGGGYFAYNAMQAGQAANSASAVDMLS